MGSRFFSELRDHRKILGRRCPGCGKILVAARNICAPCSRQIEDWVEVKDEGTVQAFTVVRYASAIQPLKPPFGYEIIRLDGADMEMTHVLYGSHPSTPILTP